MILFVIRDHIEEDTPAQVLREKIIKEMDKIWNELEKPPHINKSALISDFFEFQFCALPHMKLAKDQFSREAKAFRARFVDPQDPAYLFATSYHGSKTVPMDGFLHYAQNERSD